MPTPAPMMARIPASVTNTILRFAERGDGAAAGPTRSKPPVIDLANNRFRFNFILPMRLDRHSSKFPARAGLHLRHGYRGGFGPALHRVCRLIVAGIRKVGFGVKVKRPETGG